MPHGGVTTRGGHVWMPGGPRPKFYYRGKNYRVSVLVCEAFHGPKPFPSAVAMHLDEDATNNRADNLRWGTQKENLRMPGLIAYCRSRVGDKNPFRKGRLQLLTK
jgi:hypothetical protein